MSRAECAQQILIEALHDKRLSERDAASLRRHQKSCAVCRQEAEQLRRLEQLGSEHGAKPSRTELERRRARANLLRAAATPRPDASSFGGRRLLLAAVVTLVVLLGFWLRPAGLHAPLAIGTQPLGHALAEGDALAQALVEAKASSERSGHEAIAAQVRPLPRADYQRERRGSTERVRLHDGTIDIEVQALRGEQRFIVATEDAEVEVRGTRFQVSAEDGRLRAVRVREGRVELRYGGFAQMLGAGEGWSAEAAAEPSTTDPAASADKSARRSSPQHKPVAIAKAQPRDPSAMAAYPAAAAVPGASADVRKEGLAAPAGGSSAGASGAAPMSAAARSFSMAMRHLEEGRYRQAHKQLSAFSRQHAGDPRAEDADFLAIIALQRAGRHARAAEAARRYLQRHPQGARRREAAAVANAPRR